MSLCQDNLDWLLDVSSEELIQFLDYQPTARPRLSARELSDCLKAVNSLRSFPGTSDQSQTLDLIRQKLSQLF